MPLQHTPTPLRLVIDDSKKPLLISEDGLCIATIYTCDEYRASEIMNAVNCHDELIEALEIADKLIRGNLLKPGHPLYETAKLKVEQALSKAKGEGK